jgi:hypothetical protein
MLEQGGSSRKASVVDLSSSSDERDLITDVSWDEEFARRLFGDLNRNVLGPLGDGKIIVLSDSNEEEEVHEKNTADAEAVASSIVRSLASTAYADADDIPTGVKMIIMMTTPPIRRLMAATVVETIPGCLRLLRQEGAWGRRASRRISMVWHCYHFFSLVKRSWDDNAKSLTYFDTLYACFSLL